MSGPQFWLRNTNGAWCGPEQLITKSSKKLKAFRCGREKKSGLRVIGKNRIAVSSITLLARGRFGVNMAYPIIERSVFRRHQLWGAFKSKISASHPSYPCSNQARTSARFIMILVEEFTYRETFDSWANHLPCRFYFDIIRKAINDCQ